MDDWTRFTAQPLSGGGVHVWLSSLDACVPCPDSLSLLSGEEMARLAGMGSALQRQRFSAGRVLMRRIIGQYVDQAAQDLQFIRGDNGKVELATADGQAPLYLSLSHCEGHIALALCRDAIVGLDLETTMRRCNRDMVADRFFTAYERATLCGAQPHEQARHFFLSWTLKEAYIKATGEGFRTHLDQIGFSVNRTGCIRFDALPSGDCDPRRWSFAHLELPDAMFMALCSPMGAIRKSAVRVHQMGADGGAHLLHALRYCQTQPFMTPVA